MRTIDLFSGCGGLSLGFEAADFEVVAAFDKWKEACDIYTANFTHPVFQIDLSDIKDVGQFKEWKPDIIIGSPPCQDFSSAGKRDESLGRADLTISYARIVSQVKPEWFLMENVERIKKSLVLQEAFSILKKSGYGLNSIILDASYCGVPQTRKRFMLIGHLYSDDGFINEYCLKNQANTPMTVYDYLGGKLGCEFYYRHPRSYARRGIFSIYEPSPTIRGVNRPIPKSYKRHEGDPCDPKDARPLTTKERSYLQTFPEDFKWTGTKTSIEQMIGNAVPVKLGQYIADCLFQYVRDGSSEKRCVGNKQLELFEMMHT